MDKIIEFINTDTFSIIIFCIIAILFIENIFIIIKFSKLNKKYKEFMKKLGNGKNIEEDLETYMYRVEKIEKENAEITNYIKNLDDDLTKCIQKIGIVRYNAFKDTGSNLSFALALLNEHDNGVVLNGIYSREMSNIYAKPIINGKSEYTISEEEEQAIQQAINTNKTIRI